MKKKVAFYNLGCKVNDFDTESMKACFLKVGYELVPFDAAADVYVVSESGKWPAFSGCVGESRGYRSRLASSLRNSLIPIVTSPFSSLRSRIGSRTIRIFRNESLTFRSGRFS